MSSLPLKKRSFFLEPTSPEPHNKKETSKSIAISNDQYNIDEPTSDSELDNVQSKGESSKTNEIPRQSSSNLTEEESSVKLPENGKNVDSPNDDNYNAMEIENSVEPKKISHNTNVSVKSDPSTFDEEKKLHESSSKAEITKKTKKEKLKMVSSEPQSPKRVSSLKEEKNQSQEEKPLKIPKEKKNGQTNETRTKKSEAKKGDITTKKKKESKNVEISKEELEDSDALSSDIEETSDKSTKEKRQKRVKRQPTSKKDTQHHKTKKTKESENAEESDENLELISLDKLIPKVKPIEDFDDEELDSLYERLTEENKRLLFKDTVRQYPNLIGKWYLISDTKENLSDAITERFNSSEQSIKYSRLIDISILNINDPLFSSNLNTTRKLLDSRNDNDALNQTIIKTLQYITNTTKTCQEYFAKGKIDLGLLVLRLIIGKYTKGTICKESFISENEESLLIDQVIGCFSAFSDDDISREHHEILLEIMDDLEKGIVHSSSKSQFKSGSETTKQRWAAQLKE